jgi:chemotaxis protein histidine kinase CheA
VAQQIFRNLHTIKGNATLLGLKSVAEITHEAESQATALLGDNADAVKAAAVAIRVELAKLHGELLSQLQKRSKAQSGLGDEVGRFFATSSHEIAEILLKVETIFSNASFSDNALRILHTMKSNASIHHQKDIEDKIHEIETAMVDILKSVNSGRKVEKEEVLSLHTRLKKLHDYLVTKLSGAKSKSEKSRDSNPAANVLESVRQTGGKIVSELGQIVSDADSAAMAFRDLHTLKRTASMNNLGKVVDALHRAESALDVICKRLADGRTGTSEEVSNFRAEMSAMCAVVERQLQGKVTSIGRKLKGDGSESELLMANLKEYLSQFAESGQTSFADADAITALFRELHTSKGNAERLGLHSLVKVIHAAEDLVTALGDKIRAGEDDAALVQKLQGALGEVSAACATGPSQKVRRAHAS